MFSGEVLLGPSACQWSLCIFQGGLQVKSCLRKGVMGYMLV